MNLRYAISELREHATEPYWWRDRFLSRVVSQYFTRLNRPDADPLVDQEWDNVILLDACRYDLFEEVLAENRLPGRLDRRTSVQSGTPGYLAENFAGRTFHDVVYVTANPYVTTELPEDTFHAVDAVWEDAWDDESQTVMPDVMAERGLAAAEAYPDKRIVVHFNQPHAPFVGDVTLDSYNVSAIREEALGRDGPNADERTPTPFELLDIGEVDRDTVWTGYRGNLEAAFPAVERLLEDLSGLTAVTSDHGNALGERAWPFPIKVYGHPLGVLIPALTEVPWHTNQNGERKAVVAEQPESASDDAAATETAERLRALGYAE